MLLNSNEYLCCRISEGSPISFQRCAKKWFNRALGDVAIDWVLIVQVKRGAGLDACLSQHKTA